MPPNRSRDYERGRTRASLARSLAPCDLGGLCTWSASAGRRGNIRRSRYGSGSGDTPRPRAPVAQRADVSGEFWTETHAQACGVAVVVRAMPGLLAGAQSFDEVLSRTTDAFPRIADVLDLAPTLHLLAERLDLALASMAASLTDTLESKRAWQLRSSRTSSVEPLRSTRQNSPERSGGASRRSSPSTARLSSPGDGRVATHNPELLQIEPSGLIALARSLGHLRPTGAIGILHAIVVDHGEPMRMINLCDRGAQFGMSRNQIGVLIHSGRAASLYLLDRGIVGLAGRDEGADARHYEASRPGAMARVSIGNGIGFDRDGFIAADLDVRRSIREQGLGLPWPLSIIYFSDHADLHLDGKPRRLIVRANGHLDLPRIATGVAGAARLGGDYKGPPPPDRAQGSEGGGTGGGHRR